MNEKDYEYFITWFKQIFGRLPLQHNEIDEKVKAAWRHGFYTGCRTILENQLFS